MQKEDWNRRNVSREKFKIKLKEKKQAKKKSTKKLQIKETNEKNPTLGKMPLIAANYLLETWAAHCQTKTCSRMTESFLRQYTVELN